MKVASEQPSNILVPINPPIENTNFTATKIIEISSVAAKLPSSSTTKVLTEVNKLENGTGDTKNGSSVKTIPKIETNNFPTTQVSINTNATTSAPISTLKKIETVIVTESNPELSLPKAEINSQPPLPMSTNQVVTTIATKRTVVKFNDNGDSIDNEHETGKNCAEHELSVEAKTTKKIKKSKQNRGKILESDAPSNKTKKIAVRFDSKGESIDDVDDGKHNCKDHIMSNEGESTKKHKKLKENGEEEIIDSKNEASNERETSSDHESEEDDGIPVITIPLADILRKYARQLRGGAAADNSKYEYEYEDKSNDFVIKGFTGNPKKLGDNNSLSKEL